MIAEIAAKAPKSSNGSKKTSDASSFANKPLLLGDSGTKYGPIQGFDKMTYLNPHPAALALALLALAACTEIHIETSESTSPNVIMSPRPPADQASPPVAANNNQPLIDREAPAVFETATFALG